MQLFTLTLGSLVGTESMMLCYRTSLQSLQAELPFPCAFTAALSLVGRSNGSCGCWMKRALILEDLKEFMVKHLFHVHSPGMVVKQSWYKKKAASRNAMLKKEKETIFPWGKINVQSNYNWEFESLAQWKLIIGKGSRYGLQRNKQLRWIYSKPLGTSLRIYTVMKKIYFL